jgi:hypothetical protein
MEIASAGDVRGDESCGEVGSSVTERVFSHTHRIVLLHIIWIHGLQSPQAVSRIKPSERGWIRSIGSNSV